MGSAARHSLLIVALAVALLLGPFHATAALVDPMQAALQRAQATGAYTFNGDVVEIAAPTSRVSNVGKPSRPR